MSKRIPNKIMYCTFILILIFGIFSCYILVPSHTGIYLLNSDTMPRHHISEQNERYSVYWQLHKNMSNRFNMRNRPRLSRPHRDFSYAYSNDSNLMKLKLPGTVCGESEYLCNLVRNPLCKYLLTYPLFSQHHHKTGSVLSNHIRNHLAQWCGLMDDSEAYNKSLTHRLIARPDILYEILYETNHSIAVLFHFIRDPVDTILSGYYYHLKAQENWLRRHTIRSTAFGYPRVQNLNLYRDIIYGEVNEDDYFKKYWVTTKKARFCFDLPKNINIKFFDEFKRNGYHLDIHMTVKGFYHLFYSGPVDDYILRKRENRDIKIRNDEYGLFWEFIRYFNCEWSYQYLMKEIGNKYFNIYMPFDLRSFEKDQRFDKNVNEIMDVWNIIDNKENNDILKKAGIINMNITDERNDLYQRLRIEKYARHGHGTKGKFDKDKSIELLLSLNESVCQLIKNMTVLLNFEWKHQSYC